MGERNITVFNGNAEASKVNILPSPKWFYSPEILLLSAVIALIWMCIGKLKLMKNTELKKHLTKTLANTVLFGILTGGHWILSYFEGYWFYKILLGIFYACVVSQFHYICYGSR